MAKKNMAKREVSAGYEFESGFTADVGYRWSNE